AQRWLTDQDALIVVHDQDQERRVRAALSELRANLARQDGVTLSDEPSTEVPIPGVPDVIANTRTQPRILQAETAYEERRERRTAWQKQSGISLGHIVEPNVAGRAYTLAPSAGSGGTSYDSMTRALSVAAETHLITHEPDAWTAVHFSNEARRLEESMSARARAEQVRQAAVSAELRRVRERDAERETVRRASHEAERV